MNLVKYLNTYIDPPKHTHPAPGRFGIDHPLAHNAQHPERIICINPTCRTYVRLRRVALIKASATLCLWTIIVIITAEMIAYTLDH